MNKRIHMSEDALEAVKNSVVSLGSNEFPRIASQLISRFVSFDSCVFIAYHKGRKPWSCFRESTTPEFHKVIDRQYLSSAYLLDPAYQLYLSGAPDGAYRISDIAPDQFKQSEYYKTYYRETNVVDEIVFMCKLVNGTTMTLCVVREGDVPKAYSKEETKAFHAISGLVCELIRKNWTHKNIDLGELEFRGENLIRELQTYAKDHKKIDLTYRQSEVACLILKGYSSHAIADIMKVSYQTVRVFRKQLYSRCNISSQSELFSFFLSVLS